MRKLILGTILLFTLFFTTACSYATAPDNQAVANAPMETIAPVSYNPNTNVYANQDAITDWQGLSMYVADGSVTPIGLRVSMLNDNTELNFGHGVMFSIEKYLDRSWAQVPFINDAAWILPLLNVAPNTTVEENILWEHMHGELQPGLYRIVRNFIENDWYNPVPMWQREIPEAYLYATFEVKENWQVAHALWQEEQDSLAHVAFSRFDGLNLEISEYSPRSMTFTLTNNNSTYTYVINSVFIGWEDNIEGLGSAGAMEYAIFPSWMANSNSWPFGEEKSLVPGDHFSLDVDWYDQIGNLTPSMGRLSPNPYVFEIVVDVTLAVSEEYIRDNFHKILPGVPTTGHRIRAYFDISE